MRITLLSIALLIASTCALAAEQSDNRTIAEKIAASHRAHLARLDKCGRDAPCRERAHTTLRKALARLDADREVVAADRRAALVAKR